MKGNMIFGIYGHNETSISIAAWLCHSMIFSQFGTKSV